MSHVNDERKLESARQVVAEERYLAFQFGSEQYAIPLLLVREVIEMSATTPIPQAPSYFKGVLDLRGQLISVIDLRVKLNLEKTVDGPKTAIIILNTENVNMGFIVDRVNSVLAFSSQDISPPPHSIVGQEGPLIGVARSGNQVTMILNHRVALDSQDVDFSKALQSEKRTA